MRHFRAAGMLLGTTALLAACGGPSFPARELARPAVPAFPSPPPGAVVFSRQTGAHAVALAVVARKGGGLLVQASVVGPDRNGVSGLAVRLAIDGSKRRGAPCRPGCYQAQFAVARARSVGVDVQGAGATTHWVVLLPAAWPAADGSEVLRRAGAVWRGLRSLTVHDRLASDSEHVISTTWRIVAPDRVAYAIDGGGGAIIIGRRRWDRAHGGAWIASRQEPPLTQPVPPWVAVANAHILGSVSVGGRKAWRVSFFDPKTPAWFEVLVDQRTARTLELRMNTTAHFMHERYRSFNEPTAIVPPR
jgi:hypothetical protein